MPSVKALEKQNKILLKTSAKNQAIFENLGESLFVVDLNEKVEMVNDAALAMTGLSRKEWIGKKWNEGIILINEEGEKVKTEKSVVSLAIKREVSIFEKTFSCIKKEGSSFPVAITASPIWFNKKKIGATLILRDITHEKEVDKAKTEFVSFASHQLRTPLATINWYAEMMLDGDVGKLNEDQKSYLNEIYSSCKRMVKLVNDILNVSRLELGTFIIEPEPTQLQDLANQNLKELEGKIHEKKTVVKKSYDKKIPKIQLDKKLMGMVFQNLLSNAIKYTPEKGRVFLTLKKEPKHVLITVKDNGYGINKEQQDKIFGKLFRADNVKEMNIEGTGLGLYIIKSIVERSEGQIWFESEEGKGSTFYVRMPLKGMQAKKGTKSLS